MSKIQMKKVKSCRVYIKVNNRHVYHSNNHPSKHHKSSQTRVMSLPGLERLRSCLDHAASSFRINEKSHLRVNGLTDKSGWAFVLNN